jgi:catechol 2,3-dioxygenase-like lactoylglutathione lyase family enzyme
LVWRWFSGLTKSIAHELAESVGAAMRQFAFLGVLLCFGVSVVCYAQSRNATTNNQSSTKSEENQAMSKVSVRYMIDDVPAARDFYVTHLGFTLESDASPAFASVSRDGVRLLLSGKESSGRRTLPDGRQPIPGGWNRIHIQVEDLQSEVKRLRKSGIKFRSEIISGPGGSQIVLDDPSGNPVELFQAR